jgi:hypothetical protein
MPFVGHVTHQQRVVKLDAAFREARLIGKETRIDFMHGQRFDAPLSGFKRDSIQPMRVAADRITQRALFKKRRGFRESSAAS